MARLSYHVGRGRRPGTAQGIIMSNRPRRTIVSRRRSSSIVLAAIASLLLSTAALASPANERSPASERGSGVDRVDVIVSIDDRSGVSGAELASRTTARFGGTVLHTYEHALTGFAASLPASAIAALENDSRVRSIERDQVVNIAHHQCGHTRGKGTGNFCSISGTVTGIETGATVTLSGAAEPESQPVTTTSDSFVFKELAAGSYTVTAAEGARAVSRDVELTSADVEVALELPADGGGDDGGGDSGDDGGDSGDDGGGGDPIDDPACAFAGDWGNAPWGIERIGTGSNTGAATGCGVDVYVIDTGIQVDHVNLAVADKGFASERCRGGGCSAEWDDDHGHGTHVAGTVAALGKQIVDGTTVVGVAPDVTLYSVKVLNRQGSGTRSGVIAGIDWVAGEASVSGAPAVANMSLGGSGSKTGTCTSDGFIGTDTYHEAICNASKEGVVFVVAAGNSGANAAGAVPAAYDDTVITVSATMKGDDWPSWSNWGNLEAQWTAATSAPVALAAPGVSILSTWINGGTRTISGTSMASPHVAGAAALVLETGTFTGDLGNFNGVRDALLTASESTTTGFTNTSENPHGEPFVDVRSFVLSGS